MSMQTDQASIRPFEMHVSEEDLVEMCRRVNATRWPSMDWPGSRSTGVRTVKGAHKRTDRGVASARYLKLRRST